MTFGGVKTNIETKEQYDSLINQIIEWYVSKRYPGYQVVEVEKEVVDVGSSEAVC